MKTVVSLDPEKTREYVAMMVLHGLSDKEIEHSLPGMALPHLIFADYLARTGNDDMAEAGYRDALHYMESEKETAPAYFFQVYQYYRSKGRHDDALVVMRKAVNIFPDNVAIGLTMADAYEEAGISYKATDEYRRVLILDPTNVAARKKLDGAR